MDAVRLVNQTLAVLTRDFGAETIVPEHIFPLIPTAIKVLQDKLLASNAAKLENFRASFTVAVSSGWEANLAVSSEAGLRLDLINLAKIRFSYTSDANLKPLVSLVNSIQRFERNGIQDGFLPLGFLEGTILKLKHPSALTRPNYVVIKGINCPNAVDGISSELEGDMVAVLTEIAKLDIKERRRNLDIAERKA